MDTSNSFRAIDSQAKSTLLDVLHKSFRTVADEFCFTQENNPKHGSFITMEELDILIANGLEMYGYFDNEVLVGAVGISKSKSDEMYYIEKLCVLPDKRHKGIGRALVRYSMNKIKERDGTIVSIGIINKSEKLKNWYKNIGFKEYEIKKYSNLQFEVCIMRTRL
jgi:diamine N-acetyltransferase